MKLLAERFVNEVDDAMEVCMKQAGVSIMDLKDINTDDLASIQAILKLFDTSKKILVSQAEMMDEMNAKLDKLLQKLDKEGKEA